MSAPTSPVSPLDQPINWRRVRAEITLLPNLLSLTRAVLVLPIVLLYGNPAPAMERVVLALLILTYVSDYLDGYFAKTLSQRSAAGLILDPLADKIWTLAMLVMLNSHRGLPDWVLWSLIGRDVVIVALNVFCWRKCGRVMPSDEVGRKYMVGLGLMVILMTLRLEIGLWLAYLLVVWGAATLAKYYFNLRRVVLRFAQVSGKAAG